MKPLEGVGATLGLPRRRKRMTRQKMSLPLSGPGPDAGDGKKEIRGDTLDSDEEEIRGGKKPKTSHSQQNAPKVEMVKCDKCNEEVPKDKCLNVGTGRWPKFRCKAFKNAESQLKKHEVAPERENDDEKDKEDDLRSGRKALQKLKEKHPVEYDEMIKHAAKKFKEMEDTAAAEGRSTHPRAMYTHRRSYAAQVVDMIVVRVSVGKVQDIAWLKKRAVIKYYENIQGFEKEEAEAKFQEILQKDVLRLF